MRQNEAVLNEGHRPAVKTVEMNKRGLSEDTCLERTAAAMETDCLTVSKKA